MRRLLRAVVAGMCLSGAAIAAYRLWGWEAAVLIASVMIWIDLSMGGGE